LRFFSELVFINALDEELASLELCNGAWAKS